MTTAPAAATLSTPSPSPSPTLAVVRATRAEAAGAALTVAGLSVLERALRQLARLPDLRIVLLTDGAIPLPVAIPPRVEVRPATPDVAAEIAALSREGAGAASFVVGADVVRRQSDALTGGVRVVDETTRRQAEDGIFAELLRGDLGVVARYLNKKISFRITRYLLCKLPVTPNQVTLGAALIGFLGCLLIARGTYAATVAGFLLAQAQSVLDGCDGELARVRFQQSAIGEWLDTLVDDFLNLSLLASMGVGLWRAGHGWPAAVASGAGCVMLLVYNAVSYRELVRQGVGGELLKIRWRLTRGADMKSLMNDGARRPRGVALALLSLGRRDVFIFSWLVLAVLNFLPGALFWGVVIALSCFVTAVGQLVLRDPDASTPHAGQ